jgi:hypothetical protein
MASEIQTTRCAYISTYQRCRQKKLQTPFASSGCAAARRIGLRRASRGTYCRSANATNYSLLGLLVAAAASAMLRKWVPGQQPRVRLLISVHQKTCPCWRCTQFCCFLLAQVQETIHHVADLCARRDATSWAAYHSFCCSAGLPDRLRSCTDLVLLAIGLLQHLFVLESRLLFACDMSCWVYRSLCPPNGWMVARATSGEWRDGDRLLPNVSEAQFCKGCQIDMAKEL